jgi:choloylglycine hydrolase
LVNGEWVYARTLEFGEDLVSFDLLFVPRRINHVGMSNNENQPTAKWKNKYAHVGFNPFGLPLVADGLNEKGLACGAFYFPGWAEYEQVSNNQNIP